MSIKHLALVAVCALTAFAANAAANFYWTSAEGDFSDASKWHKGTYNGATGELPGAEDTCYLWGSNCTVRVDGEYRIGALWTNSGATGKTNVFTLVGSGKLRLGTTSGATSFQVASQTILTMDGPDIYTDNGVQYCEGGTLVVKQGTYTPRTHYLKLAPGRLVIDGGTVTSYDETSGTHSTGRQIIMQNGWNTTGEYPPLCFIDLKSGVLECRCGFTVGTFTMTGGVWDRTKVTQVNGIHQFSTNLILDIQGGERIAVGPEIPRNDTNFFNVAELEGGYPGSKWCPISADGKYRFGSITTPLLFFISNNVELAGQTLDVSSYQLATGACDVVMDIGTIRADTTTMLTTYTEHRPINVHSPKVVRFEAHGAGTMRILSIANTDVLWRFDKGIDVNTTALNGGGAANFRFGNACFGEGATVDFAGVGDALLYFANYAGTAGNANGRSGFSNLLSRVSMRGGKLSMENWAYNNNGYPFQTERFVLGPGAKLHTQFATYAHFDANEVEMDASNEIILTKPENGASNYFPPSPVTIGPKHVNDFQTAATRPTITWATAGMEEDWNFEWINGMPVVWRKNGDQRATCSMTRTKMSKWRGTVDGDWFNSANWFIDTDAGKEQATNSLEQAMVFDGGYTNTRITVDSTAKAYQIRVYDKTAPVAFVGTGEIELGSNDRTSQGATEWNVNAAIVSTSDNPLTFDVPVRLSADISGSRYFTINQASRSYVAFMKEFDGGGVATFKGDVRIGGAATADNFVFNAQANGLPKRRTRLWVIPGGSVTAKKQTWLQSGGDISIFISSNATFMVKDSRSDECFWGYNDTRPPIRVKAFGKFDCHAPLGGSAPVAFKGEGEVRLADTGSRATADYPVSFDGVTFAVDAFTPGHPIALAGSPTWAATTDWTYDLGALSVPAGETLTVNTGDLDTGDGHATAIDSALTADTLVKTGAGSLTLGSAANAIGDVRVEAGTLALGASQAFSTLSFAPGTTLRIAAAGATLAVAESLDLSNVTITLTGAARTALGNAWTSILTVPEGQAFVGLPTMADANCAMRIVETETGFALQLRNKPGLIFSIR